MSEETREGGCLCGAVRYRVAGAPSWTGNCHCTSCRKASGAAFLTYAVFPQSRFEVVEGKPVLYESSPGVERTFCGRCGTTLTYHADRFPGDVEITIATLDRPEDVPPTCHVWTSERLPWLHLGDDLRQYPRSSVAEETGDGA